VIIGPTGSVAAARLKRLVSPDYDPMLLSAAQRWLIARRERTVNRSNTVR